MTPVCTAEPTDQPVTVGYLPGEATALVSYLAIRLGKPALDAAAFCKGAT